MDIVDNNSPYRRLLLHVDDIEALLACADLCERRGYAMGMAEEGRPALMKAIAELERYRPSDGEFMSKMGRNIDT